MKKTIKDLFKLITAIATVAGIYMLPVIRSKRSLQRSKKYPMMIFDDDFDDESF
jgi:hypothetical protein